MSPLEKFDALRGQLKLGFMSLATILESVHCLRGSRLTARPNLVVSCANIVCDEARQRRVDLPSLIVFIFKVVASGSRFLDLCCRRAELH